MFQYVVSFKGGERETLKKKRKRKVGGWGLGPSSSWLPSYYWSTWIRFISVTSWLPFFFYFFSSLELLMCVGWGRRGVGGGGGALKHLKLLSPHRRHTASLSAHCLCLCVRSDVQEAIRQNLTPLLFWWKWSKNHHPGPTNPRDPPLPPTPPPTAAVRVDVVLLYLLSCQVQEVMSG